MAKQISSELVEFMSDLVWDRLIEEFGERFSDVTYMAMEDPRFRKEMSTLEDIDHHVLAELVKEQIGKAFKTY
jgi:translation initiation factor 2 alpha subunit (eIF-2alpha)